MMAMSAKNLFYLPSITAFIFVTIFDPADVVLGLKVPLFILCFITGGLVALVRPDRIYVPMPLIFYTLLFVAIPLFSIFVYYLKSGTDPYAGFIMLKAYFFIFLAIILVVTDIDVTKYLSNVLVLMAVFIISLFIFLLIFPDYFSLMNFVGMETQIFYPGKRSYDGTFVFQQAYFACSPMLVVPIAYYSFRFRESYNKDFWSLILLVISIVGLFLAGSRNNMFVAVIMPISLYIIFTRKSIFPIFLVSCLLMVLVSLFVNELASFLDPTEYSNMSKLSYLSDYAEIFSDLNNLFFGQGLGAYHKFSIFSEPYFITELTYLEVIRNFGLFLGLVILLMLVNPIFKSFRLGKNALLQKHMAVGYSFYLLMCVTNPNLFSSMGILILCLLLSGLYSARKVSDAVPSRAHVINV
jgi:hypothetical protein